MTQISVNPNYISPNKSPVTNPVTKSETAPASQVSTPAMQKPTFSTTAAAAKQIRTELTTQEEKEKFSAIYVHLDERRKKEFIGLLKNGRLLSTNSDNKSTTMDNLYKMISTERAAGLTPAIVLNETIQAVANPFTITQKFGNMPKQYQKDIPQNIKANPKATGSVINEQTINVNDSNDCVSASIEFSLAMKNPAEFARFAEGLTSPNIAVEKTIDLKNLTDNTLDSVWLLNQFEIPYSIKDFDKANLTLNPDKNAIVRAQIQNNDQDKGERSVIDVLMQSTFMNIASQQSYDSLTDIRGGKFNDDNRGLIEFEKTFTESVVENKNKISVTYQNTDENGKVIGYTTDFKTMEKQLLDTLAGGDNIIIGYTYSVKNGDLPKPFPDKKLDEEITTGHEITIIGAAKDKNGKLLFICNDTDDDNPNPVIYKADEFLPKIHHAGIPEHIVKNDINMDESWRDGLKAYKEYKESNKKTA